MRKLLLLVLCLGLIGCATIKPITYEERQHVYVANFDTVWSKTVEMLIEENFPIKSMDKENGIIQTEYNKNEIKETWLNKARCSLNILISVINTNNTRVIINPYYEVYFPSPIGSSQPGEWATKNDKDKIFIDKYFKVLDEKLNSK